MIPHRSCFPIKCNYMHSWMVKSEFSLSKDRRSRLGHDNFWLESSHISETSFSDKRRATHVNPEYWTHKQHTKNAMLVWQLNEMQIFFVLHKVAIFFLWGHKKRTKTNCEKGYTFISGENLRIIRFFGNLIVMVRRITFLAWRPDI